MGIGLVRSFVRLSNCLCFGFVRVCGLGEFLGAVVLAISLRIRFPMSIDSCRLDDYVAVAVYVYAVTLWVDYVVYYLDLIC
jgi:hypothetical protein